MSKVSVYVSEFLAHDAVGVGGGQHPPGFCFVHCSKEGFGSGGDLSCADLSEHPGHSLIAAGYEAVGWWFC